MLGTGMGLMLRGVRVRLLVLRKGSQQSPSIDQVPVVRDGDGAESSRPQGGLGVLPGRRPRGRVAHMPHCQVPLQRGQVPVLENLGNQTHIFVNQDL